jgi:hypothetical protein
MSRTKTMKFKKKIHHFIYKNEEKNQNRITKSLIQKKEVSIHCLRFQKIKILKLIRNHK